MRKKIWSIAGALALTFSAANAQAQNGETIQIGWTAWSDAEFITKLTARVLEERMDQSVELIQTDIAPQYQGVAQGDIDMMMMSWLPGTHADYYEEVASDVTNLGILYDHAKLGWVVPDYIPEDQLSSISDLQNDEIRERLDGTITGIDPGAGLTRLSEQALEDYNLDGYELQVSSGAGMTAALDRAISNEEWIVATGWSPHWKFGAYDLRYLEDPQGTLGSFERIHAIARKDFASENHEAATMVGRIWMPLDELQAAMYEARQTSYEEAIDTYIDENEERINYWVTGEI